MFKQQTVFLGTSLGFTFIELVSGLSIGLLLVSVLLKEVHSATSLQSVTENHYQYIHLTQVVAASYSKTISDFDSHPLALPPVISSHGILRYQHGGLHPIMNSSKAPQSGSDIITVYRLAPQRSLQVINSQSDYVTVCPRYDAFTPSNYTKGFVGLGADFSVEIKGNFTQHPTLSSCFNASIHSVDSVSHKKQNWLVPFVRLLIPIEEHYSLYIDSQGNLRYLGHAGLLVKENQPIIAGIQQVSLSVDIVPPISRYELSLSLKTTSGDSFKHRAFSRLLHDQDENYLFSLNEP